MEIALEKPSQEKAKRCRPNAHSGTLRQRHHFRAQIHQEYKNATAPLLVHCRALAIWNIDWRGWIGRAKPRKLRNNSVSSRLGKGMSSSLTSSLNRLKLTQSFSVQTLRNCTAQIKTKPEHTGDMFQLEHTERMFPPEYLRFYPVIPVASVAKVFSGRKSGNKITSRIVCESVSSMHSRSTPTPTPPAGGIPYDSARI